MKKFGIYIHWPYCLSKCPYCDFFSQVRKDIPQDKIIEEYIADLGFYNQMTKDKKVTSIFFGGGTPSLIKPHNVEKIIDYIKNNWKCADDIEISLEANPNTNHPTMFQDLRTAGINRLSMGIQSLRDEDLKFLGRTHDSKEAFKAMEEVINTFENQSIDLIYTLPHQQISNWKEDLNTISRMGFKHLSLYQLTIEDGTVFAKNNVEPMEENLATDMYIMTSEFLESSGYNRYEISNFAQKGFEARHNLTYWEGYDYLGIGPSAHGRIGLKTTMHQRKIEILTPAERAEELLIMGLRLKEGINKKRFKEICGLELDSVIDISKAENFLINTPTTLKTTPQGVLLLNKIIEEIYI